MKKGLVLAVIILLSLASMVFSGSIGPGIDTSTGEQVWFGVQAYAHYPPGELYIEFTTPEPGNYTFYIGWGTVDQGSGWIRFRLTDINNNYIKDVTIPVTEQVTFHTEKLFSVVLQGNTTYRLWIDMEYLECTLMLWAYDKNSDPSVVYYNHPQYGWVEFADLAWYAVYTTTEYPPTQPIQEPIASLKDRYVDKDGIHLVIELMNWKPNSTVSIYIQRLGYSTYDEIAEAVVDNYGYGLKEIVLDYINEGDKLLATGYDQNGNYYSTYIIKFNESLIPPASPGWWDTVLGWFNTLYTYAGLIYSAVLSALPYAAAFWCLGLAGAVIKSVEECSLAPLFDYLYKNYQLLTSLASLAIKVAEKAYQATNTIINIFSKIVGVIKALIFG